MKGTTNLVTRRCTIILQIRSSIDGVVVGLINHYEFVKELMDYLDFFFTLERATCHVSMKYVGLSIVHTRHSVVDTRAPNPLLLIL